MKIGILSDAHGNAIGFKKCLEALRQHTERIFFLGDAVGYFPFPNEVIDELRTDHSITSLLGNHDAMLLGKLTYKEEVEPVYQMKRSAEVISAENFSFLETLQPSLYWEHDGLRFLFVHGSPARPLTEYVYPDTDLEPFGDVDADVIFMGHTHRPFIKEQNNKLFINAGSCGFCRDIGNRVTAVVFDTITKEVSLLEIGLNPGKIIDTYGDFIHQSVKDVLTRNNKFEYDA